MVGPRCPVVRDGLARRSPRTSSRTTAYLSARYRCDGIAAVGAVPALWIQRIAVEPAVETLVMGSRTLAPLDTEHVIAGHRNPQHEYRCQEPPVR